MKATHQGHCQICGGLFKVNNITLQISEHGFNKKHGFYSGSCSGSNYPPYELSNNCLRHRIDQHTKEAQGLDDTATAGDQLAYIHAIHKLEMKRNRWEPSPLIPVEK